MVTHEVQEEYQASKNNTCYYTPQAQEDNQIEHPTLAKTLSPLVEMYLLPLQLLSWKHLHQPLSTRRSKKLSIVDPFNTLAQVSEFQNPSRFAVLGDVDIPPDEPMSSLGFTKGGRETRPPIKFKDLE
ncbi:unnamed protein product [Eruca vesicaria subsp. sativa]|uniref:Uncharacterized protein n=1 Tax=Eruca vesicaria subsp. sativa TaxID=29727 RepID=A0ABC8JHZ1_ERUVS|nr:unnamed protein product [Eruca vesicaria subsp. sativa]